ncbi:similar to hypothetical protein MGC36831 (predicted), isoform CRA_e [Rattus norvegicus]|uniref:Uncharacterized protein RGD1306215_predicted n=1 Tax=Rattus norvegicus TaxID=10116 RepID=A6JT68_RAT|nr:similar to hypothetical protein MGC36831 (predicted), isoform CRA_e [Rattus norvegicus]
MAPPPLSLPLCILPPGSGSPRLVCYCEPENGGDWDRDDFNLYVTDAAELWSTCFSPDSLATLVRNCTGDRRHLEACHLPPLPVAVVLIAFPRLGSLECPVGPGSWALSDNYVFPTESPIWPKWD